jgi:hypothetical protein
MAIIALVLAAKFTFRAWAGMGRPWVCSLAVATSLPLAFVGAQLLSISTSWRPLNAL